MSSDRNQYWRDYYAKNKERLRPIRTASYHSWRKRNEEVDRLRRKLGCSVDDARTLLNFPHLFKTFEVNKRGETT